MDIYSVFAQTAIKFPHKTALVSANTRLTYQQLYQKTAAFATVLEQYHLSPKAIVGLYTQHSIDSIVAILAILKVGAAYLPFDPSYPRQQLQYIFQDAQPELMLIQPQLLANDGKNEAPWTEEPFCEPFCEPFWTGTAIDLNTASLTATEDSHAAPSPEFVATANAAPMNRNLAYVMYTSGSTGKPKGVLVAHSGVLRLVKNNHFAVMDHQQVYLQLAPLAFDASTFEIWAPLLNGGTLAILPTAQPSLHDISRAITDYQVTSLWLTAGLFHLMVEHQLQGLKPLRQLLAGGDVLSVSHVQTVMKQFPHCQVINGYGPTENTTFSCCYAFPAGFDEAKAPIGKAIANTETYVLDEHLAEVPAGEEGELYVGGAGVALGYLHLPELTAKHFIVNPFSNVKTAANVNNLLYKTGDRVRLRADGNYAFCGRKDRQIKRNGKRIELDEIEQVLCGLASVAEGAVIVSGADAGRVDIAAIVVIAQDRVLPGQVFQEPVFQEQVFQEQPRQAAVKQLLHEQLAKLLPEVMVPSRIHVIAQMPLTANGKLDRKQLLQLVAAMVEETSNSITKSDEMPLTPPLELDKVDLVYDLRRMWHQVLAKETIGLDDNFFDLGGTSLQLLALQACIKTELGQDLDMVDLFQFPNIRALAKHINDPRLQKETAVEAIATVRHIARKQGKKAAMQRARKQRQQIKT